MRIHYTLEGANGDAVNGQPVSPLHPLPVTGNFNASTTARATASAPSYGEGVDSPISCDLNGNLRIAGTFSASVTDMLNKTGAVSTAAVLFTQADTTGYFSVSVQITAYSGNASDAIVAEISNDGSAWGVVSDALTGASAMKAVGEYVFPCPAKQFRVRQTVNVGSATSSCTAQFRGAIFPGVPSGAATSAKQPALGTAGLASADVLTVQGIASMTALKVDGSAVTQPVSGTVTANAGTNLNTSTLALESGGNLATLTTVVGAKADAKNSATDTTSVSAMSVWKQISASIQAAAASLAGSLTVGTHAVTQSGTWTVQPGNTANTTAWKVDGSAVTQPVSGAVTADPTAVTPVLVDALSATVKGVLASATGKLMSYYIYNPNSSAAYVQIFDVATTGGVTVGTTVPKWSVAIPATSAANLGGLNMAFSNGIQVAATTTAKGSSAPSTALDCNFGYR